MWNAATMLLKGEGGVKSRELGMHLVQVAAEHGSNSACLYLANCYESGSDGFEQSAELAAQWREAAWDIDNEQDLAEPVNVDDYLSERPTKPKFSTSD
jgi:TPR repeat protein